jgi:hypothetical protein
MGRNYNLQDYLRLRFSFVPRNKMADRVLGRKADKIASFIGAEQRFDTGRRPFPAGNFRIKHGG